MFFKQSLRTLALGGLLLATGCTFHSTAREWHGRVGTAGVPVYYTSATKVGFTLAIFIPFLGDMSIEGMVDRLTKRIAAEGGDKVHIVQGDQEAYWYGWPPFTWVITPVVSTVTAEYQPTAEVFGADAAERAEGDSFVVPEFD